MFRQGSLGSETSASLFFPPASLKLCGKEAENDQHPVSKASCLMQLVDTPNLNNALSLSAPKVSVPFQATRSAPMLARMLTQPFNSIIWGKKMHAVPIIYWCRQESCLVPGAESCMRGWPGDALSVSREKAGARSGAATWASVHGSSSVFSEL